MKFSWSEHKRTLGRSQITALLATFIDYSSLIVLVEKLGVYYVWAVGIAAALGAVTNFLSNRWWAFESQSEFRSEAVRYGLISLGSLAWNVFLVWLITSQVGFAYYISKIIVGITVGLFWNYPLHKYWVFQSKVILS